MTRWSRDGISDVCSPVLFAKLPRWGAGGFGAAAPATPVGARRVLERPAQQAQVLVGYLGPGLSDPAYPAVRVLGAVLGGGMAGRLFVELREKRGLAYALGVLIPFRTGPSFFVTRSEEHTSELQSRLHLVCRL